MRCIYHCTIILETGQSMPPCREISYKKLWHIRKIEYYAPITKDDIEMH